jgi:peptidoglycan/LPS O-acetylase OafA/YrhL
MFGTFRLLLAMLVLLKHFKTTEVFSGLAVWAFFLLSGFLITGILCTRYGNSRSGLVEFGVNRAIRLLPTYWAAVLASAALVMAFSNVADPRAINSAWALPTHVLELIPSLVILGGTLLGLGRWENALSPSAWAVEVEVLMYVCSAWWIARSEAASRRTFLSCLAIFPLLWLGSRYAARHGAMELSGSLIYSFLPAALLPYSLGSWLWHLRDRVRPPASRAAALALCALGIAICGLVVARFSVTAAFVLSLPMFAYVTGLLSQVRAVGSWRRADTFFGFMSYPVYLMQWIGDYLVLIASVLLGIQPWMFAATGGGLVNATVPGFIAVCATTLCIAALVAKWIEGPIEVRRHGLASHLTSVLVERSDRRLRP